MRALRVLPIAVTLLLVSANSRRVTAQSAYPGWSFTINITTDSGGAAARSSFAMRQQITDRYLRMEFVQVSGSSAMASVEGMYQVFDGVDSTMTMVVPSQHMATVMGLSMIKLPQLPIGPQIAQHFTRNDFEDLGAGEKISGHATHHVRVTTAGTVDVTMLGETCSQHLETVSDTWIAPDVDFGSVASVFGSKLGSMFGGAAPTAEQTGVKAAAMPKGATLRTVSKTTHRNTAGEPTVVTSTMELLDINQRPIDAASFSVPADFKTMDMRKLLADLPAGMLDSAMKAGLATSAAATTKAMCGAGGRD
jgi:hypothetical protein